MTQAAPKSRFVLLIDQTLESFVSLDEHHRLALGIDRRARHARQHALAFLGQRGMSANSVAAVHGRLTPAGGRVYRRTDSWLELRFTASIARCAPDERRNPAQSV
jgi:uncharacterized membrane protein